MKATYDGPYKKVVNGKVTDMFRYKVSGTPEEIAAYKKDKGDFLRTDEKDGSPLHFDRNYSGDVVELKKAQKSGRYYADLGKLIAQNSLCKQFADSPLGTAIANQAAAQFLFATPASAPVAATVAEEASDLNEG